MARKYFRGETVPSSPAQTLRFGVQGTLRDTKENGKAIKLAGDSGCVLCVVGDPIDGFITSVEPASSDGYTIVGVQRRDDKYVIADGAQADGTGTLAVGDYVVCGTPVAEGTSFALTGSGPNTYQKVRKATAQPGVAAPDAAQINYLLKGAWKVVSLLESGTGAVGTRILIERAFLAN